MLYYVSKNNIALHKGAFNTLEEATAFGKKWLEENDNPNQFNSPNYCGDKRTLIKAKWGIRKGRYYNSYRVYVKSTFVTHYDFGVSSPHSHESTVLITAKK